MNIRTVLALIVLVSLLMSTAAMARVSPPRGSNAPAITLKDLSGETIGTAQLRNRTLVLIFGELGHEGARQACTDVLDIIGDRRLTGESVVPMLIIARDAPPAQLKEEASQGRFPALILHDPNREAFGAYRVLVVPTLVVVDGRGKVVYCLPAYRHKSRDLLNDAILTSAGKMTAAEFEQVIDPNARPAATPEVLKSERLVHLGVELAKVGMDDIAEARFKEAIVLVPGHAGATLGLGDLMLRQDRLSEAEQLFRSLATAAPDSVDASLGIVAVQVKRVGKDLSTAEATLKSIIDKNPKNPRARYLMGQVHEQRGDYPAAMAEYKIASKLLLEH